jgi:glycerol-3-phosphate dehydrogenase
MIVSKGMFISEYLDNFFPNKLAYCVLSGPSFAVEMMKKYPTLVVVASKDKNVYIISHSKIKISEKV